MFRFQPGLAVAIGGLLLTVGCSDKPGSESAQSTGGLEKIPASSLGFKVVETAESADTKQIRSRTVELLAGSAFAELDKLAGEHRTLLREMPAGLWSLSDV